MLELLRQLTDAITCCLAFFATPFIYLEIYLERYIPWWLAVIITLAAEGYAFILLHPVFERIKHILFPWTRPREEHQFSEPELDCAPVELLFQEPQPERPPQPMLLVPDFALTTFTTDTTEAQ